MNYFMHYFTIISLETWTLKPAGCCWCHPSDFRFDVNVTTLNYPDRGHRCRGNQWWEGTYATSFNFSNDFGCISVQVETCTNIHPKSLLFSFYWKNTDARNSVK